MIKKKAKGKNFNAPKPPKEVKAVQSESESDDGQDMLDMIEDEDLEYMKNIYNVNKKGGKRKRKDSVEDTDKLEDDYENVVEQPKKTRGLLPLKSKDGLIKRSVEINEEEQEEEGEEDIANESEDADDSDDVGSDEGSDIEPEAKELNVAEPISTAKLLAQRSEVLHQKKLHIGVLSSALLESPEEKILNFSKLLKFLDEDTLGADVTIKKITIVAILEVFKDILPSYSIKHQDNKEVRLKKETLKLHKYETILLQFYKKFLQKLEKYADVLKKKMGDSRRRTSDEIILGETSVKAMCELLLSHPYFNYSINIAQVVIPFLNSRSKELREFVKSTCKTVFKEDKKDEITLKILQVLNKFLRTRAHNVNATMLEVLLHLKIRDVNLDQQVENDIKQKKLQSKKGNVLQLSKKERKRKKKLKELESELLETQAEENKQTKKKNITEITKIVFGIYFRVLKSSTNPKILSVCLEGLSKYAHCINFDFYVDIVNVLEQLLKEDYLGHRERLYIIKTVFTILTGVGEALNVDPTRFYNSLYENVQHVQFRNKNNTFEVLLDTLNVALLKRRKKITLKRLLGFIKRLVTMSLQLNHSGALAMLTCARTSILMNSQADMLLDCDNEVGSGEYNPFVNDPEFCNASSTFLYELTLLRKHYHPVVREFVSHFLKGCPTTGDGILAPTYAGKSGFDIYKDFDMSEMVFKPTIPPPKKSAIKMKNRRLSFVDNQFRKRCFVKANCKLSDSVFI